MHRAKVHESIYQLACNQLGKSDKSSEALALITSRFLDSFLSNLKESMDQQKINEIPHEMNPILNGNVVYPEYEVISTNHICNALKMMRFNEISKKIENESIELNCQKRNEAFQRLKNQSFVSHDDHFVIARDLIQNGRMMTAEEAHRKLLERKRPHRKKKAGKTQKKTKGRQKFFF